MNIFALHPDPQIAASYHCDQHLGVMIKESAQMLSTMFHSKFPEETRIRSLIYRPTHENHPCTKWIGQDLYNTHWLIRLCYELQDIRYTLGKEEHASLQVIKIIDQVIQSHPYGLAPTSFIFCGPDRIGWRNDLDIHQKYQRYYREKHAEWLDTRRPMTYKNRPIPPFMADLF